MAKKRRRTIHHCTCPLCHQHPYGAVARQHTAINRVLVTLDEKHRRRFVGLLAIQWGPRSLSLLSRITGLNRRTIRRGKWELEHPSHQAPPRIRQAGGGRLTVEKNNRRY